MSDLAVNLSRSGHIVDSRCDAGMDCAVVVSVCVHSARGFRPAAKSDCVRNY